MSLSTYGLNNLIPYSKNLLTDQTFEKLLVQLDVANVAFDVTLGLGHNSNTSMRVLANFCAQNAVGKVTMLYPSATPQGSEDLSVCLVTNLHSGVENLYLIRLHAQVASIGKIINGAAIATIGSSQPFLVPQAQPFDINFTINGNQISATFSTTGGVTPATVAATDSALPGFKQFGYQSELSHGAYGQLMQFTQLPNT
jgi:hypothetical protein